MAGGRKNKTAPAPAPQKVAPASSPVPPSHISSGSDNSDEELTHSRTSTSSVEEDQVKQNGNHAPQTGFSFISRVTSIPLVKDSVSTLHSYANDNKYSRYALDKAGSTLESVNKYTEGYQSRLQPHIAKVDQLATKSLDILEVNFPIVTKPTSEIVNQVTKPVVYVGETSKNAYSQIQSTLDTRVAAPVRSVTSSIASTASQTANKVTSAAVSTRDQITSTAVSTRDQLTTAATSTATNIATQVNTHAVPFVDGFETIVNRILPANADNEKTADGQTNQATRVVDIGRSVSLRVSNRVGVAVAPVTKSANELRAAAEKNVVVVKSKDQLQALNNHLNTVIASLKVHTKELSENVQKVPREASSRVSELSTKVLSEFESLSKYLKEHSPALPESVQNRLKPLVDFVNDRYVVVKGEIVKTDVTAAQKARNILQLTTEQTLPVLQGAADEIRSTLNGYQVKAQEAVHKGAHKVKELNSSLNLASYRAYHSVRVILVGK
ncbi:hypothetical protein BGZ46_004127 [Entomortierella lignicola]|nr:hypothetical protein BGZ46_004127 [Entomortierella lignicola]